MIKFTYENEFDFEVSKTFETLEALQDWVMSNIIGNLNVIPTELVVNGMVCDLEEYLAKLTDLKEREYNMPSTDLQYQDRKGFVDKEWL